MTRPFVCKHARHPALNEPRPNAECCREEEHRSYKNEPLPSRNDKSKHDHEHCCRSYKQLKTVPQWLPVLIRYSLTRGHGMYSPFLRGSCFRCSSQTDKSKSLSVAETCSRRAKLQLCGHNFTPRVLQGDALRGRMDEILIRARVTFWSKMHKWPHSLIASCSNLCSNADEKQRKIQHLVVN